MAAPRSPNYPRISLKEAIEGIRKIWSKDGKNRITLEAALAHLGYKSNNGAAQGTVSALRKYGLLSAGDGKLWVSGIAIDIVEGANSPDIYRAALRKAAFMPPLFQELRRDFPDSIPSQDGLRFHLIKKNFTAEGAAQAAATYRDTMELVTAGGGAYTDTGKPGDNAGASPIVVGDLVQWESQGALQFSSPRRVTGFSEDGQFAFVEGTLSGLPVDQLTRHEGEEPPMQSQAQAPPPAMTPPPTPKSAAPPPLAPPREGFKQDVFTLAEGDVILRWPEGLSVESFEDLQGWLEIMQKKIARAAGVELKK